MKAVKRALDPGLMINPGTMLDIAADSHRSVKIQRNNQHIHDTYKKEDQR
jgi:hypothetical protein